PEQRRQFAPLCPDFVLELQSPTDDLVTLQAKLAEYIANGARLGWLVAPAEQRVYIYRPQQPVEIVQHPATLGGDPLLPGFVMDFRFVWD
ncbi:MAG: Uma2 family endonuclease, partial [Gloeomargarita sp. SKYG98]|nr:Uma2 family endonuclease [Gloeomargarita sp. SKYG98]